jgi:ATP-dependent RNA helicase DDX35
MYINNFLLTSMSLTFWKPGTAGPGSNLDRSSETEENIVPYALADSFSSIRSQRERLPIFKHRKMATT